MLHHLQSLHWWAWGLSSGVTEAYGAVPQEHKPLFLPMCWRLPCPPCALSKKFTEDTNWYWSRYVFHHLAGARGSSGIPEPGSTSYLGLSFQRAISSFQPSKWPGSPIQVDLLKEAGQGCLCNAYKRRASERAKRCPSRRGCQGVTFALSAKHKSLENENNLRLRMQRNAPSSAGLCRWRRQ